jgi:hypothetical protein
VRAFDRLRPNGFSIDLDRRVIVALAWTAVPDFD